LSDLKRITIKIYWMNYIGRPGPIKGVDMPRFPQVARNHTHQADIVSLPHDDGNKYL